MKENGIRKLKNILNEYEDYKEEKYGKRNYKWICYGKENPRISADRTEGEGVNNCLYEDESRAVIISKGYNFIKWLFDKDKINTRAQVIKDVETWGSEIKDVVCYDGYESLLMLLSISSTPIEDLISYLK